jgi:hypothetical protein
MKGGGGTWGSGLEGLEAVAVVCCCLAGSVDSLSCFVLFLNSFHLLVFASCSTEPPRQPLPPLQRCNLFNLLVVTKQTMVTNIFMVLSVWGLLPSTDISYALYTAKSHFQWLGGIKMLGDLKAGPQTHFHLRHLLLGGASMYGSIFASIVLTCLIGCIVSYSGDEEATVERPKWSRTAASKVTNLSNRSTPALTSHWDAATAAKLAAATGAGASLDLSPQLQAHQIAAPFHQGSETQIKHPSPLNQDQEVKPPKHQSGTSAKAKKTSEVQLKAWHSFHN